MQVGCASLGKHAASHKAGDLAVVSLLLPCASGVSSLPALFVALSHLSAPDQLLQPDHRIETEACTVSVMWVSSETTVWTEMDSSRGLREGQECWLITSLVHPPAPPLRLRRSAFWLPSLENITTNPTCTKRAASKQRHSAQHTCRPRNLMHLQFLCSVLCQQDGFIRMWR